MPGTGNEAGARPSSAASSVSAASDLLSEGWPSANGIFRYVNFVLYASIRMHALCYGFSLCGSSE